MAEYVDAQTPACEMGAEAGSEEAINALVPEIMAAKNRIGQLLLQINSQYKFFNNASTVEQMIKNRAEILAKYQSQISAAAATINASSKGGGLIMAEKTEQEMKKIISNAKNDLRKARANIYGTKRDIADQELYKKTALEAMSVVYSLRQAITGTTEKIIIAYEGDESSQLFTAEVPIVEFLNNVETVSNINIGIRATSSFRGADPFQLTFKSSVIQQLASMAKDTGGVKPLSYQMQDRLITTKENLDTYLEEQKIIKALDVLRQDGKKRYKVVRRGVPGYIVENMMANLNSVAEQEQVALSKQGTDEWFTGGDFSGKDGTEYSAKSFLYGTPTLAKMSSIQRVLQELYNNLDPKLNPAEIYAKICDLLKVNTQGLNQAISADIDKVLNILSG